MCARIMLEIESEEESMSGQNLVRRLDEGRSRGWVLERRRTGRGFDMDGICKSVDVSAEDDEDDDLGAQNNVDRGGVR